MALDTNSKIFVVHVAIRKQEDMPVHSEKQAQVGALLFNEAPTEVSAEYFNYNNVFSMEYATELPENTRMNKYAIELEEGEQLSFGSIYSLEPVELETLKTYIKTNLAHSFIRPCKSLAGAPILFNRKSDGSFYLCVDY